MSYHRGFAAALAVLAFAAPLSAQRVTQSAAAPASDVAHVTVAVVAADPAPRLFVESPEFTVSADRMLFTDARSTPAPTNVAMAAGAAGGRNAALMLFGGAALIVGSVIDGDAGTIIMIGGGVVALVGLWRYLQ